MRRTTSDALSSDALSQMLISSFGWSWTNRMLVARRRRTARMRTGTPMLARGVILMQRIVHSSEATRLVPLDPPPNRIDQLMSDLPLIDPAGPLP